MRIPVSRPHPRGRHRYGLITTARALNDLGSQTGPSPPILTKVSVASFGPSEWAESLKVQPNSPLGGCELGATPERLKSKSVEERVNPLMEPTGWAGSAM